MSQPNLFSSKTEFNGNKRLVEHGIQTEDADYRAHVVYPEAVYVFPTKPVRLIIFNHPTRRSRVPGSDVDTAEGHIVPISNIPQLQTIPIPIAVAETYKIFESDSTSVKGARAVQIFLCLLRQGKVAVSMVCKEVISKAAQIEGSDVIAVANKRIQVKCDLPALRTGNLFLQIREANPGRMY